jgi:hypothetical protein
MGHPAMRLLGTTYLLIPFTNLFKSVPRLIVEQLAVYYKF